MTDTTYQPRNTAHPDANTTHVTNNYNGDGKSAIAGTVIGGGLAALGAAAVVGGNLYFGSQEIDRRAETRLQDQIAYNEFVNGEQEGEIRDLENGVGKNASAIRENRHKLENLEDRINSSFPQRIEGNSTNTPQQQSSSSGLYQRADDCSKAEMRDITDNIHFQNPQGELLGTISQVNYEDNTPDSFSERVLSEFDQKIFDSTGLHNAASLTFNNPNGNDIRVLYSPNNQGEVREILEDKIKGDCIVGDYTITVNDFANISSRGINSSDTSNSASNTYHQTPVQATYKSTPTSTPQKSAGVKDQINVKWRGKNQTLLLGDQRSDYEAQVEKFINDRMSCSNGYVVNGKFVNDVVGYIVKENGDGGSFDRFEGIRCHNNLHTPDGEGGANGNGPSGPTGGGSQGRGAVGQANGANGVN
ncbi:MAG: hypothetical protein ACLFPL_02105 [Candidatus Nanoarchaeia archaeon]